MDPAGGAEGYASIAVSGATTISAIDDNSVFLEGTKVSVFGGIHFTTLTAGSNTFAMRFRTNAGTAGFQKRSITVIDLGS